MQDFSFLKNNIDVIILNALYGGDKYGYEIAKEILEKTDNRYEIKQPTLYAYLKRLESQDLIKSYWGTQSNGGRRRYYKLTEVGRDFCQQTSADWLNRKSLMDTLLIDSFTAGTVSSENSHPVEPANLDEVTRLNKARIKREKQIDSQTLDNHEELSKELDRLLNQTETNPQSAEQPSGHVSQIASQENVKEQIQEKLSFENEPAQPVQLVDENRLDVFEVRQDNAEDFIKQFDQTAQNFATNSKNASDDSNNNYKEMFNSILFDQLAGMQKYDQEQPIDDFTYINDRPLALEEVANQFAKEGIRMRIYSSTTAVYRSKELFPVKKVVCMATWGAILAVVVLLSIVLLATLKTGVYVTFIVTMCVLLLVPISFTVAAIVDPKRKNKPNLNFKLLIIYSIICSAVIILLTFGINILFNLLQLNDTGAVATQIGIPTIVSLALPLFMLLLKLLFEKYTK